MAIRTDAELILVVAIDLEMVGVGPDSRHEAVLQVSVVNYDGKVL